MKGDVLVEAVNMDTGQLLVQRDDGKHGIVQASGWFVRGVLTKTPQLADTVAFEIDGRRYDCPLQNLGPPVTFQ